MGADIISTGAKLADLAANDWDIVAPARMHFQFARRRICRVLAFSSFAETASRSSSPPSSLEASNSVRHALARTAGDTAELPAIIFKTRTGSRSSGATSGTVTLRGRPPRFRRGLREVSITLTIGRNPFACTVFSGARQVFGIFNGARRHPLYGSPRGYRGVDCQTFRYPTSNSSAFPPIYRRFHPDDIFGARE